MGGKKIYENVSGVRVSGSWVGAMILQAATAGGRENRRRVTCTEIVRHAVVRSCPRPEGEGGPPAHTEAFSPQRTTELKTVFVFTSTLRRYLGHHHHHHHPQRYDPISPRSRIQYIDLSFSSLSFSLSFSLSLSLSLLWNTPPRERITKPKETSAKQFPLRF